jgi:hypothetical protein
MFWIEAFYLKDILLFWFSNLWSRAYLIKDFSETRGDHWVWYLRFRKMNSHKQNTRDYIRKYNLKFSVTNKDLIDFLEFSNIYKIIMILFINRQSKVTFLGWPILSSFLYNWFIVELILVQNMHPIFASERYTTNNQSLITNSKIDVSYMKGPRSRDRIIVGFKTP